MPITTWLHQLTRKYSDCDTLLQIKQVSKSFDRPQRFWAVKEVSLTLHRGESLGLVGESGCGKSTLAKIILRLFPRIDSGCIESSFHAWKNIYEFDSSSVEMRNYRKQVQMIFQNPDVALNPGMTVGQIIKEAVKMGVNKTKGRWNPLKKRMEISEQIQ
ncbi:MAG: ATP-binding cassette domain-containing protein, partial [Planctomycetota bacterium]